jgi:hypothetical protein
MPELSVLLVENNPYDRAVLDSLLADSDSISLSYTAIVDGKLGSIGLEQVAKRKAHLVLLDLALTKRCERALAKSDVQQQLSGRYLRAISDSLAEYPSSEFLYISRLTNTIIDLGDQLTSREKCYKTLTEIIEGTKASRIREVATLLRDDQRPDLKYLLNILWGNLDSIQGATMLSQAPSLWRIFFAIAKRSDLCFAIVSHYANALTTPALTQLISFRNPVPAALIDEVYGALVFNKTDLANLSECLTEAHDRWVKKASLHSFLGPFANYPVITESGRRTNLPDTLQRFEALLVKCGREPSDRPRCFVLWDETQSLIGSHHSWGLAKWKQLFRRKSMPLVGYQSLEELRIDQATHQFDCYLVLDTPKDNEADCWAEKLLPVLDFREKRGLVTLLFAGGSGEAMRKTKAVLGGLVRLFKVPTFNNRATWRRSLLWLPSSKPSIAESISNIPILLKDDGSVSAVLDSEDCGKVLSFTECLEELKRSKREASESLNLLANSLGDGKPWDCVLNTITKLVRYARENPDQPLRSGFVEVGLAAPPYSVSKS